MGGNLEFFDNLDTASPVASGNDADQPDDSTSNAPTQDDTGNLEDSQVQDDTTDDVTDTGDDSRETLYAGKYKSVDDLEKAYLNAQKSGTQLAQELSELRRGQQPAKPQQQTQMQAPPQQMAFPAGFEEQVERAFKVNPAATIQALVDYNVSHKMEQQQQGYSDMAVQMEAMKVGMKYPDYREVAPKIVEVFKDNPSLWSIPNPVENAYLIAKSKYAEENIEAAREAGKKAALAGKEARKRGAIEGQKGIAGDSKQTASPEDEIINDIMAFAKGGNNAFF